jgi:hypothetical protein
MDPGICKMPLFQKRAKGYDDSRQHMEKYHKFQIAQLTDRIFAPNSRKVTQMHTQALE